MRGEGSAERRTRSAGAGSPELRPQFSELNDGCADRMGRRLSVLARLIVLAVGSSLGREQLRLGTSAANYCVHAAVNVITAREVRSFPRCSSFPDAKSRLWERLGQKPCPFSRRPRAAFARRYGPRPCF